MVVSRLRFLLGRPQSADTPARATHAFDRAEYARGYHGGPVLGASTLGELALSPELHDEAWAILDRLEPDDNVGHVRDFVAEGRRLAGREWRYVDIASALAAATELLRPSSYLEVEGRRLKLGQRLRVQEGLIIEMQDQEGGGRQTRQPRRPRHSMSGWIRRTRGSTSPVAKASYASRISSMTRC
jgi:hypothetical protein